MTKHALAGSETMMTTDKVQKQIRDLILVLNYIVKRQRDQGVHLPDVSARP